MILNNFLKLNNKMEIYYDAKRLYKNNLYLNKQDTIHQPIIKLNIKNNCLYTLLMYDPDVIGGNKIYWFIININNNFKGNIILKYKTPKPPKHTDNHHYIFCLFQQSEYIEKIYCKTRFITIQELLRKLNIKMKLVDFKFFLSSY